MVDTDFVHQTVLLNEAVEALLTDLNGHYVDVPLGVADTRMRFCKSYSHKAV